MRFGMMLGLWAGVTAAIMSQSNANPDSPLKAEQSKPLTAYDISATYGSDTIRMVLTTNGGSNQYSTMINNKVMASATIAANGTNASFADYVEASAKVIATVGADPAQFGLALAAEVTSDGGFKTDGLAALVKDGAKPAASSTPLTMSVGDQN